MSRILDIDPITGSWETVEYDDGNDQIIYRRYQDVEPVLDMNKRLQSVGLDRREPMWHAASIPNVIVHKWLVEFGVNVMRKEHWPQVKRLLNSNEYRYLRTHEFIL